MATQLEGASMAMSLGEGLFCGFPNSKKYKFFLLQSTSYLNFLVRYMTYRPKTYRHTWIKSVRRHEQNTDSFRYMTEIWTEWIMETTRSIRTFAPDICHILKGETQPLKTWPLRKKNFWSSREKKIPKNVATKLEGWGGRATKKELFLRLPLAILTGCWHWQSPLLYRQPFGLINQWNHFIRKDVVPRALQPERGAGHCHLLQEDVGRRHLPQEWPRPQGNVSDRKWYIKHSFPLYFLEKKNLSPKK